MGIVGPDASSERSPDPEDQLTPGLAHEVAGSAPRASRSPGNANGRATDARATDARAYDSSPLDLHDELVQALFAANLLAEVLPDLWRKSPEEARRNQEVLRQLTQGALMETWLLRQEFRSGALAECPLATLLRTLAQATAGCRRLAVRLAVDEDTSVPADVHIALYRIAQEALGEMTQGLGTTEAAIGLQRRPGYVELIVEGDGQSLQSGQGSGDRPRLERIREHARSIHATLTLDSRAGGGLRVVVAWPGSGSQDQRSPPDLSAPPGR